MDEELMANLLANFFGRAKKYNLGWGLFLVSISLAEDLYFYRAYLLLGSFFFTPTIKMM